MISVGRARRSLTNGSIRIPSDIFRRRSFWAGALLLALAAAVYWPALTGGFVWDDDAYFTYNGIKAADGLRRIWLTTSCADYWPVTSTTLWLEWRLWGLHTLGYHLTNLALHGAEALLFWAVLRRLGIRGAYLGALLFALHPVNVESVAWIAERKNLMAMLFALLSTLAYLKARRAEASACDRRQYCLSLLAFLLALLSKASVAPLPLVFLGLILWRRRPTWKDLVLLLPFFALAAGLVEVNFWFREHGYVEVVRGVTPAGRVAGAGMAGLFYLGKALLPVRLSLVYPQWSLPPGDPRIWLPLLAVAAVTGFLLIRRREARGALFTWAYFWVMLIPVLGLTDVYFMRYSLVADHYEHLALAGLLALAAAGWSCWHARSAAAAIAGAVAVLGLFGWLSRGQAALYRDEETLYLATLEVNPDCWLARNNLGMLWAREGRLPEAMAQFREALRLYPDFANAHSNLGTALGETGHLAEGMAEYRVAIGLDPILPDAHSGLGNDLVDLGRLSEGIAQLQEALRLKPDFPEARNGLGNALAKSGRWSEAVAQYEEALRLRPDFVETDNNLGIALAKVGRLEDGIARLRTALRLRPGYADAHANLATLLREAGRPGEAAAEQREADRLRRIRP